MNDSTTNSGSDTQTVAHNGLVRHRSCKEWGLGILAWERGDRRGYQFEDGKLRVFKRGYYKLLEDVDRPADIMQEITAKLERALGLSLARSEGENSGGLGEPQLSFDDQLATFYREYPDGFQKGTWVTKIRGQGAKRHLKRHRDAAIEKARDRLSAEALETLIDGSRYAEIVDRCVSVLSLTNLVTRSQLSPLLRLRPAQQRGFAVALFELLHGTANYDLRFERFVAAIAVSGKEPSWTLATALPALVHPDDHVCVRPTTMCEQAKWMAPRLPYTKTPNAVVYERFRRMAVAVRDKLRADGLTATDLLDVYDFMYLTLRPATKR